jgi:hypothetical protein
MAEHRRPVTDTFPEEAAAMAEEAVTQVAGSSS